MINMIQRILTVYWLQADGIYQKDGTGAIVSATMLGPTTVHAQSGTDEVSVLWPEGTPVPVIGDRIAVTVTVENKCD